MITDLGMVIGVSAAAAVIIIILVVVIAVVTAKSRKRWDIVNIDLVECSVRCNNAFGLIYVDFPIHKFSI